MMIELVNMSNNSYSIDLTLSHKDIEGKTLYLPKGRERKKIPMTVLNEKNIKSYLSKNKIAIVVNGALLTGDFDKLDNLKYLKDQKENESSNDIPENPNKFKKNFLKKN